MYLQQKLYQHNQGSLLVSKKLVYMRNSQFFSHRKQHDCRRSRQGIRWTPNTRLKTEMTSIGLEKSSRLSFLYSRKLMYQFIIFIYNKASPLINQKFMQFEISPTPTQRKTLPSRGIKTSPPIWMQEKRARDQELWKAGNQKYWIIENKAYDFTNFVDRHPGGESWIRLTQGQDITEHFIVHHLDEKKARDLLPKYYVGECENKVTRFTFEEDGFYRTIKRRVLQKFTIPQLRDQKTSKLYALIILLSWVLCVSLAILKNSYMLAIICAPLMVGLVGIGHNFVHHKESFYRYFLLLVGFTHREWQIMHCISHHLYPNTELDFEIAAFQPIGYYLRSMPKNKWYCQFLLQVLLLFLQPINMILKLFILPIIKRVKPDIMYAFPLLIFSAAYLVNGSFMEALKLYLVLYCSFSFLLMKVLFCGHRVQDTWTEGSEKIEDYGQHTVCATSDTDTWIQGIWSYLLLAGFNIHVAHHLFPTADHHVLPRINEMVRQLARERGLKKNEKTRIQCMVSLNRGFMGRLPYVGGGK